MAFPFPDSVDECWFFINSFNQYLWNAYYDPPNVLGTENTSVIKTKIPCEAFISTKENR